MSHKIEVIADYSGTWCGNSLRFATEAEAEGYAQDLMSRWLSVRETRVVASDEPVNYVWNGKHALPLDDDGTARLRVGRGV